MPTIARKGSLKGFTAFDVEAAANRAKNEKLYLDSSNVVRAKAVQEEHERWRRRHSPQGRIERMNAAHKAWAMQHVMPYCEADELDEETWLNYLMRKDVRAFAAVKSQLGIDLEDMAHVAWWMRLQELDHADIYLVSMEILADEAEQEERRKKSESRDDFRE